MGWLDNVRGRNEGVGWGIGNWENLTNQVWRLEGAHYHEDQPAGLIHSGSVLRRGREYFVRLNLVGI